MPSLSTELLIWELASMRRGKCEIKYGGVKYFE